jgi:hypothetical protein
MSHRWAAKATPMKTPWPRRSTASTTPSGPIAGRRGERTRWRSRRSNGCHGSTTIACSNPSATPRLQKLREAIPSDSPVSPSRRRHGLNRPASMKAGRQGIGMPDRYGLAASRSVGAVLSVLAKHRERRFSMIENTDALGVSALAAPIQRAGMPALGVIVIAGPSSRLTSERMQEFGPALLAVADELAATSDASALLKSSNAGTWDDIAETLATAGEDPAKCE